MDDSGQREDRVPGINIFRENSNEKGTLRGSFFSTLIFRVQAEFSAVKSVYFVLNGMGNKSHWNTPAFCMGLSFPVYP